ncbi:MAG: DUF1579 domain-containing protein [Burkholderiaceae bacterium]|nr:DUF1579 domain-containing protein [Burkholderiaceae bacterium]
MKLHRVAQYLVVVTGLSLAIAAPAAEKKKMDEKAAMEAMQAASNPGEAQKKLEPLAGNFSVKVKSWMDPSKPPELSDATTERKWIFGGRYLDENYQGSFMGQPFSGKGTQGYDNVTKHYYSTWIDSMSTGTTTSVGMLEGKVFKYKGMMSDPASGKQVPYTMNVTIADNDHHTLEMWGPGPDGKNVKWMEMAFTRTK